MEMLTMFRPRKGDDHLVRIYSQHVRYRAQRLQVQARHLRERTHELHDRAANVLQAAWLLCFAGRKRQKE